MTTNDYYLQRKKIEERHKKDSITFGYWSVPFPVAEVFIRLIAGAIRLVGLWGYGERHAVDFKIRVNKIYLPPGLESFSGFRILHLSDLHIDAVAERAIVLKKHLIGLSADLCVVTGDFQYKIGEGLKRTAELTRELFKGLSFPDGILSVLGNHDSMDLIGELRDSGIEFLVNESKVITRNNSRIYFAGIDDPHYYGLHDIKAALSAIPSREFKIILAHSPDAAEEAAASHAEAYLCGHSHGGQLCFPGGRPLAANLRCPRKLFQGAWRMGAMQGYTSSGCGSSGIPIRLFSHPEIVVHELVVL